MSITLQNASGVNVIFDLVKGSATGTGAGQVYQNVGSSFLDTKVLTATQKIAQNGQAKARAVLRIPFTYTEGSVVKTKDMYFEVSGSIPSEAPLTEVDKAVYMVGTLAVHALFKDLASRRKFSQS